MRCPRVIQITAAEALPPEEVLRRVAAAADPRRLAVQLRDPQMSGGELLQWGRRLRSATRRVGAALLVNDRLDLARLLEADGVHLGRRSVSPADARHLLGAGLWLSRSAHGLDELAEIAAQRVDAVLLSPIFSSPGKGQPLGLEALTRARAMLPPEVALVALGGVDAEQAAPCRRAGADGVACIRAELSG